MRTALLMIIPVMSLASIQAYAQSTTTTTSETTSTAVAPPPGEEMHKEVHKSVSTPAGDREVDAKTERTINPDGTSDSSTERHAEVNGPNGMHRETDTETSSSSDR